MLYKNPGHKRQWEREHREEGNRRRRTRPARGIVFGCAAAAGVLLLALFGGQRGAIATQLWPRRCELDTRGWRAYGFAQRSS